MTQQYTPEQILWLQEAAKEKREREKKEAEGRAAREEREFCEAFNELSPEETHAAQLLSGDALYTVQNDGTARPSSEVFERVRKKLGWENADG